MAKASAWLSLMLLALATELGSAFQSRPLLPACHRGTRAKSLGARRAVTRGASITMVEMQSLADHGTLIAQSANTWASPAKAILEPFLNLGSLAFLFRIVLSWYPQVNLNKLPVNLLAWPTEPFLSVTRKVVPPAFGVDISPIIWLAFLSFLREILVSENGILTLLEAK